ncbi:hypothetical protein ACX7S9_000844 [Morganella morganii]|uniref:hypothetical protein n=1 Tax=Morganella TaxID=581 RepID=UPI00044758CF|nr:MULTISPECIES: hypothetical protein [Morganella]SSN06858.1 Uncharacterised protein [Klebsiella pneumoniae]EJD6110451.1 hypothetical protein [Morganella morganii]EJG2207089.1 hypothetical protein [Morganella morganii]EKU4017565.1 hypothetical protein [Morganella morganii]ELA7700293.1 hypothetical protein [Morganella morganii]
MNIIYVDEEVEQHRQFKSRLKDLIRTKEISVCCIFPKNSIEETIDEILSNLPDILVCDWQLNAIKEDVNYPVPYTGAKLIEEFLKVKPKFPVYLNTALVSDGISDDYTKDVNIVFPKSMSMTEPEGYDLSIIKKMEIQINKYRNQIKEWEDELIALINKKDSGELITAMEEERIIYLDDKLESSSNMKSKTPVMLKDDKNIELLMSLIKKTDEILSKVK